MYKSKSTGFFAHGGKMMKNKANGPADCLVTEMLQCLPMETVYEVSHCFDKRFKRDCRAPDASAQATLAQVMSSLCSQFCIDGAMLVR